MSLSKRRAYLASIAAIIGIWGIDALFLSFYGEMTYLAALFDSAPWWRLLLRLLFSAAAIIYYLRKYRTAGISTKLSRYEESTFNEICYGIPESGERARRLILLFPPGALSSSK